MSESMAVRNLCEHAWEYNKPAGARLSVRICSFCHTIDGEFLTSTVNEYAHEQIELCQPKPTSLQYAWSDGQRISAVDQHGGIPDSARERVILRALLGHALAQLDQYEMAGPLGIATMEPS
ncbi:hypothetical protein ACFZAO_05320 [Streptomyces griseoaurantiacus]|uniref:hypothetical protein n=1 Tax=Streptomyces griseoaurantiacus TaxID=68213 RepID=UPI0036E3DAF7